LTDLAENSLDDSPMGSLFAFPRILKSAKKMTILLGFLSKVTAPTLKDHCVLIFEDITIPLEIEVVRPMVIILTNRHPKRAIITELVNVQRL